MYVVITGASKGIGAAMAKIFVANNCNVCICARHETELFKFKSELEALNNKVKIYAFVADLSIKEGVVAFANSLLQTTETVDVLINNVGKFTTGNIIEENEDTLLELLNTNVLSAYYLVKKLFQAIKNSNCGHIINISSVAATKPFAQCGSYSISKYALMGFSHNLREELKPAGIKVTNVTPGATFSSSWDGVDVKKNRIMNAEDVAKAVYSLTQLGNNCVVEDIVLRPQLGDL
jgi:short-subunit dehydrogenase